MPDPGPSVVDALRALWSEVDCRIEHGAESGGHLEYVRERLARILDHYDRGCAPSSDASVDPVRVGTATAGEQQSARGTGGPETGNSGGAASAAVGDALNTLRKALTSEGAHSRYFHGRTRWDVFRDEVEAERAAMAQVERWHEALVQITSCNRDDFVSAREIARCALGWPDS